MQPVTTHWPASLFHTRTVSVLCGSSTAAGSHSQRSGHHSVWCPPSPQCETSGRVLLSHQSSLYSDTGWKDLSLFENKTQAGLCGTRQLNTICAHRVRDTNMAVTSKHCISDSTKRENVEEEKRSLSMSELQTDGCPHQSVLAKTLWLISVVINFIHLILLFPFLTVVKFPESILQFTMFSMLHGGCLAVLLVVFGCS